MHTLSQLRVESVSAISIDGCLVLVRAYQRSIAIPFSPEANLEVTYTTQIEATAGTVEESQCGDYVKYNPSKNCEGALYGLIIVNLQSIRRS